MKTCTWCGLEAVEDARQCSRCGMDEFRLDGQSAEGPNGMEVPDSQAPFEISPLPRNAAEGEWVTLAACVNVGEVTLLSSFLDAQGIPVRCPDELALLGNPWALHSTVYRRIEVPRSCYELARELLTDMDGSELD